MILGIGLDIVDTARLERLLSDHSQRFEELAFTPAERAACAKRADRVDALAARFAAKEACFKALGTGWSQGVSFLQVEVRNLEGGAPELELSGRAGERARERGVKHVHVTLTHAGGVGAAAVILEG
jgi:holo-[acyl-carrier protein] synthase